MSIILLFIMSNAKLIKVIILVMSPALLVTELHNRCLSLSVLFYKPAPLSKDNISDLILYCYDLPSEHLSSIHSKSDIFFSHPVDISFSVLYNCIQSYTHTIIQFKTERSI